MKGKNLFLGLLILGLALFLSSCASPDTPECPEAECPEADCPACPESEACPEAEPCPEAEAVVPDIEAAWAGSGHADSEAEAFRHWDEDDPAVVSTRCGKCHSSGGYEEFVTTGEVTTEFPALENMGVQCVACHNDATAVKDSVVMPSGIVLTGLGDESRCMECHQGRESMVSVDNRIAEAAGIENAADADPDMAYEGLGFANIHYYAAAATKYGTLAKGGYEYAGMTYDGNFAHVEEFDTCIECHSPHTLEVQVEECGVCHGEGEPQDFRMYGSAVDFDGDGDLEEGIANEIIGLQDVLYAELQNNDMVYDAHTYPYFFDEAGEGFAAWTPRLLKAAYNYQVSQKDPGGFAHGGKYIIQLLYDSIADLGGDVTALSRDDHGHFQGSAEAFRHWDEDGEVSASCSKCHSADGLPLLAKEGVTISQEISNGFQCETCHGGAEWPARYAFTSVTFPSGATVTPAEGDESSLCMQCHQGRESGADVDEAVKDALEDYAKAREEAEAAYQEAKAAGEEVEELPEESEPEHTALVSTRFLNVHYFAAGATRYGTEAGAGYEYAGKEYVGLFPHVPGFDTCVTCHDAHALEVQTDSCFTCHVGLDNVHDIRISTADFDGDGDASEGIYNEVDTMKVVLYDAIVAYSLNTETSNEVAYQSGYPYWVAANDGDDLVWTPTLLQAAYNYQYVLKDPGGFAHNGAYILQLLYDSIEAVGGDVSTMTRP